MFESVFPEANKRRAQHLALETYKATLEYQNARRDNPTMLEQNSYVDFSNPESVARMQAPILNPYGNYNPYANPNIVRQNYGYNPAQYANNMYGGYGSTWYGGGWGSFDKRFMIPSENDKYIPIGQVSQEIPVETRRKSYKEKMESVPVVTITKGSGEKVTPTQKTPQETQVKTIKIEPSYHPPMTPYTFAELNPDTYQMKIIGDTPLVWTLRDEEDLDRIVEDLAVYDKAMAHVAYNIPTIKDCTREDFNYIKLYFQERIEEFRSKELINQRFDYRAKYRYRRLPAVVIDKDGTSMPDLSKPTPIPIKIITLSGDVEYDYDRGRDELTQEEWDIFVDRAYGEMLKGAEALKAKDLMNLNKQNMPQQKPKEQPIRYNPNDPIGMKLYRMKTDQKNYVNHMNFFKHVFRHQMTPEQFDNWWYGTQTNAIRLTGRKVDSATAQQLWSQQMSENHLNTLRQFKPYDPVMMRNWFERTAIQAVNNFTKGTVKKDMSLAEYMQNLRYLDTRMHELNLEQQQRANQQAMWNRMSHDTFSKSLYQYMNSPTYSNPNPYYTPQYGTIDPRFGMPTQYIDLTNNPLAQQKKAQFLEHCHTTKGHVPLQPVYR